MDGAWIEGLLASPWLIPTVFALVVADAFLVVLPSETLVVAIGALAASTGSPVVWAVLPVAAAGAIIGDSLCYLVGRRIGLDRFIRRGGRIASVLERVRTTVRDRPAVLIFTARYIPFARIAVNLTAGAGGLPYRRYLPLSALAGVGWAIYNTAIGAVTGTAFRDQPVLAVVVSVVVAIGVGLLIDLVVRRTARPALVAEAEAPQPRTTEPRTRQPD